MAIARKKKISGLLALVQRLKTENADLRAQLQSKPKDWSEVENISLTNEERHALLGR